MSAPIVIDAQPVEPIDVTLVDKKYTINPPKAALAMRLAVESKIYSDDPSKMADILGVWVKKAFGEEKAEKIQKRLDDNDDLLDITHIMALMEKVIEVQMDEDPSS